MKRGRCLILLYFNFVMMLLIFSGVACSKSEKTITTTTVTTDTTIKAPVNPVTAATVGFFLDNWQPKTYVTPSYVAASVPTSPVAVVTIDASNVIAKIPLTIFGQNSNNWMGELYNQPLLINPLTDLNPHVIRFPAGSGSDLFFWNCSQSQPPSDAPKALVNADGSINNDSTGLYTYGQTTNNWQATVDDYYKMLALTNSVGLLTMNYGYARYGTGPTPVATAAHLAADWVRYDNGRTKYWEIGNENYGDWEAGYRINTSTNQDGQSEYLSGALYGKHFQVFYDSMKRAAQQIGQTIYIGAVEQESPTQSWETSTTIYWNSGMIPAATSADFYIGHNYFTPYNANSTPAQIFQCADSVPASMIKFMSGQITSNGGSIKPIILGEWNMDAINSNQQVSNVSGTFGVIVQGEAIKNNFGMSARWDLYNGWSGGNDMGMFSDAGETGVAQWTPRPSFYYLDYFQKYIGDRMVGDSISGTGILAYPSTYSSGQASVALVNTSANSQTVQVNFKNFRIGVRYYWWEFAGGSDNAQFSLQVFINGNGPSQIAGGPSNYSTISAKSAVTSNGIRVNVAPYSATFVLVDTY